MLNNLQNPLALIGRILLAPDLRFVHEPAACGVERPNVLVEFSETNGLVGLDQHVGVIVGS